jgi:tRNA (guanine37-N1)-methyltransferase
MRFDIVTIFPEFFRETLDCGIVGKARLAGLVEIKAHDLRRWTSDKHHVVDDRPFGGGDGMVLKPEPIFAAVETLTGSSNRESYPARTRIILLSPQGKVFTQSLADDLSKEAQHIVLLCGRYEGIDERVTELATDEISIGDYVLSGGEAAALVVVESVVRLLPGALGSNTSSVHESFSAELLDYPQYTRPPEFRGMRVPEVLMKGNHAEIARWRRQAALEKTRRNRPDLLK